jgi:hypothetical protein
MPIILAIQVAEIGEYLFRLAQAKVLRPYLKNKLEKKVWRCDWGRRVLA